MENCAKQPEIRDGTW